MMIACVSVNDINRLIMHKWVWSMHVQLGIGVKTYLPGGAKAIAVYDDACFQLLNFTFLNKIKIIITSLNCKKIH